MMVVAVIQRQNIRNIVQFKLTPSDPVCHPTDCCAKVTAALQILLQGIIAQQNIHTLSVPVRNNQ